jgi:Family of unknown function (DUF5677)
MCRAAGCHPYPRDALGVWGTQIQGPSLCLASVAAVLPHADPPNEIASGATGDRPRPMQTLGLDLLDASGGYEGLVVNGGAETAAIAGLVARQRRLMRSVYRLADAGDQLEAQILVRSQVEFLIVQKWLQLDPELYFPLWFVEDVRARFAMRTDVLNAHGVDVLEPETIEKYEEVREDKRAELARICSDRAIEVPRYPSLIEQAQAVGEAGTYALTYRYDSQTAVHPQALAIEQLLDLVPEGLVIRGEPHGAAVDTYAVSAVALLVALRSAEELPELGFVELDALDAEMATHRRQNAGNGG